MTGYLEVLRDLLLEIKNDKIDKEHTQDLIKVFQEFFVDQKQIITNIKIYRKEKKYWNSEKTLPWGVEYINVLNKYSISTLYSGYNYNGDKLRIDWEFTKHIRKIEKLGFETNSYKQEKAPSFEEAENKIAIILDALGYTETTDWK